MDHFAGWVPTVGLMITGGAILMKLSAILTELKTLLEVLTDRVMALEEHVFKKEEESVKMSVVGSRKRRNK